MNFYLAEKKVITMTNELPGIVDLSLRVRRLKKINEDYKKLGYREPFVFIDNEFYATKKEAILHPQVYSSQGLKRLKDLAGQSIGKGDSND